MIAAGKREARMEVPEAAQRYIKPNAGARGMGECVADVCVYHQQQPALDTRLDRIEQYVLALLDRKQ